MKKPPKMMKIYVLFIKRPGEKEYNLHFEDRNKWVVDEAAADIIAGNDGTKVKIETTLVPFGQYLNKVGLI